MHPLTPDVKTFLDTVPADRARSLGAWFAAFSTDVQDILLEKAKRRGAVAVVFGEETTSLGRIAG